MYLLSRYNNQAMESENVHCVRVKIVSLGGPQLGMSFISTNPSKGRKVIGNTNWYINDITIAILN